MSVETIHVVDLGCSVVQWLQASDDETVTKIHSQICMTKSLTDWLWQTDFQWISENGQLRGQSSIHREQEADGGPWSTSASQPGLRQGNWGGEQVKQPVPLGASRIED